MVRAGRMRTWCIRAIGHAYLHVACGRCLIRPV
jgi:hypothetical protein